MSLDLVPGKLCVPQRGADIFRPLGIAAAFRYKAQKQKIHSPYFITILCMLACHFSSVLTLQGVGVVSGLFLIFHDFAFAHRPLEHNPDLSFGSPVI